MRELSIFIDESGDVGRVSDFYLVALVFHEQQHGIEENVLLYERALATKRLDIMPFHFNPLINGNDEYRWKSIQMRKEHLHVFRTFVEHLPVAQAVFIYDKKKAGGHEGLASAIEKDLKVFLFDHLSYLQQFDVVIIYYDGGQSVVTEAVHQAIASCISREAIVYKDAIAGRYRLSQVADYVCGIELTRLKFERHMETKTDVTFFGAYGNFKKNFLRKLRKKRMRIVDSDPAFHGKIQAVTSKEGASKCRGRFPRLFCYSAFQVMSTRTGVSCSGVGVAGSLGN